LETELGSQTSRGYRLTRIGLVFFGALALLWLPFEDQSPILAQLLAASICLAGVLQRYFHRGARPLGRLRLAAAGVLTGLAVPPLAALLLIFKNGLHSHSGPDFSPAVLAGVLSQAPLWGLGGALIAAGLQPLFSKE
jgi:hypothetical protein